MSLVSQLYNFHSVSNVLQVSLQTGASEPLIVPAKCRLCLLGKLKLPKQTWVKVWNHTMAFWRVLILICCAWWLCIWHKTVTLALKPTSHHQVQGISTTFSLWYLWYHIWKYYQDLCFFPTRASMHTWRKHTFGHCVSAGSSNRQYERSIVMTTFMGEHG